MPASLTDGVSDGDGAHQNLRVGVEWICKNVFGASQLDQPAEVHDADLIAQVPNHGEVMRDEEVSQPELALEVAKEVDDLGLDRDVERGQRFIADDQSGPERDRAGDRDALALPPREFVGKALGRLRR